ncbi:unnamed protein product [Lota lota]
MGVGGLVSGNDDSVEHHGTMGSSQCPDASTLPNNTGSSSLHRVTPEWHLTFTLTSLQEDYQSEGRTAAPSDCPIPSSRRGLRWGEDRKEAFLCRSVVPRSYAGVSKEPPWSDQPIY